MIVEIETDYDHSTNKKLRYKVSSDGYVKATNLTRTKAKMLKKLLERSINTRQQLRSKFGIIKDR